MYDYIIVGGGIVGLAVARALVRRDPSVGVLLVEKEAELAGHQTGHNSGVIHAGVYYEPGSLKAELCVRGSRATKEFCTEHGISFRTPGKLVVATDGVQLTRMHALAERARRNGLEIHVLSGSELTEREPQIAGVGAIHVPATGIVDYRAVCRGLAGELAGAGVEVRTDTAVAALSETTDEVRVRTSTGETVRARTLVACAGLQADRVARMAGLDPSFRTVPFRGEYFRFRPSAASVASHLIYPVPDPALPFLGIHITPTIDGGVTVGPNAVLSLAREGYRKGSANLRDTADWLRFPGFWRFARHNVRTGLVEMRNSLIKRAYVAACRTYAPGVSAKDLLPHPAGIRAQIIRRDGTLVHDFLIERTDRTVHVCNAPSPAATAALPIGEMVADRYLGR